MNCDRSDREEQPNECIDPLLVQLQRELATFVDVRRPVYHWLVQVYSASPCPHPLATRETMSIAPDEPNEEYLSRRLNETEQNFTFTRVRSIVELNQPTDDRFSQPFSCRCQST